MVNQVNLLLHYTVDVQQNTNNNVQEDHAIGKIYILKLQLHVV